MVVIYSSVIHVIRKRKLPEGFPSPHAQFGPQVQPLPQLAGPLPHVAENNYI